MRHDFVLARLKLDYKNILIDAMACQQSMKEKIIVKVDDTEFDM